MKTMALGAMFLPGAALPLLLMLAGLLFIVGLRKLAAGLAILAVTCAVLPVFEPVFKSALDALPVWVSWLLLAGMVMTFIRAIGLGKFVRNMLAHTFGTLLADAIRFLWLLPFRAIGLIFRLITRGAR